MINFIQLFFVDKISRTFVIIGKGPRVSDMVSEQYLDMIPSSDSFFDDEFMEFVVPFAEQFGPSQGFLR